jgi:hypothetical protein
VASSLGGGALLAAPHWVGDTLAQPTAATFALPNVIEVRTLEENDK